ncbi:claudin-19 [Parambassis ranga]|uniref:Claudin-19 n=1 Tax=Parambassis ranga TaxID=210632 RepID=A0A6P7IH47_9TELE|nr:claudin-19-like [Parambassis ranga]
MASSGLQLLGLFFALGGVAATIAATVMVEWKKQAEGKAHSMHEGLWMSCGGAEKTACEIHESLLKLPTELQVTRAVILISLFLSFLATVVSAVGMKCTRFLDGMADSKSTIATVGGAMYIISGLLTIIVTSWYVQMIVQSFHQSHHDSYEFGKAVFVSWTGGLLTMSGGAFLSCHRCWRSKASETINSNHLLHTSGAKSNYV